MNYRVGTSEIQGDVIDEKSLIKALDPEEYALLEELREEGKAFSREAILHSRKYGTTKRRGSKVKEGDSEGQEKTSLSVAEKKVKLRGLGLSNLKRETSRAAKEYCETTL